MTQPDFRTLCAELACSVELLLEMRNSVRPMQITEDRLNRARAALATPPPEPPTAIEIIDLSIEIDDAKLGIVEFAHAALERWGHG